MFWKHALISDKTNSANSRDAKGVLFKMQSAIKCKLSKRNSMAPTDFLRSFCVHKVKHWSAEFKDWFVFILLIDFEKRKKIFKRKEKKEKKRKREKKKREKKEKRNLFESEMKDKMDVQHKTSTVSSVSWSFNNTLISSHWIASHPQWLQIIASDNGQREDEGWDRSKISVRFKTDISQSQKSNMDNIYWYIAICFPFCCCYLNY